VRSTATNSTLAKAGLTENNQQFVHHIRRKYAEGLCSVAYLCLAIVKLRAEQNYRKYNGALKQVQYKLATKA
jgi:hypothetical protein